jgi:parvulin-like peptidyl-prolyl isomerase
VRDSWRSLAASVVLIAGGAWLALAQTPGATKSGPTLVPKPTPAKTAPASPPIATVGPRSVTHQEFESREQQAISDYRQRLNQDIPSELRPAMRRQLLESLIRREMLVLEAQRRGITVSDEEAEQQLMQDAFFNPGGKFDPQRYQVVKTTQVDNYNRAIAGIKAELGARKLNEELEKDFVGNDPTIKAGAERDLTRADLDMLALRRGEYRGDIREPRETEIVAWYRAHPDQFQQGSRAKFTALQVDQPPLPAGETLDSPAGRAWKSKMRARADSALAAARGGSSFEDLEKACGSIRRDAEVVGDNFPGFWGGDAKDRSTFFATRAGQLVATPISSQTGWLVIRVSEQQPGGLAPLLRVARQIRDRMRTDARLHGEDRELREAYARKGDSLRTTGWKLRYAAFDGSAVAPANPSSAELDRWYRAHQADFSSFDASAGTIKVRPLSEVQDEVRSRWIQEQRDAAVKTSADRLLDVWQRNQRDKNLERSASVMREVGPVFQGAPPDTGAAAATLGDSLSRRPLDLRTGQEAWSRGAIVYQIYERVPNALPPFEQARPALADERALALQAKEEAGARALYDRDPKAFSTGRLVHFTRVLSLPAEPTSVRLTRAQVERYRDRHIDKYSAPEQIRVRHILIRPTGTDAASDSAARARAQQLHDRAKGGENFEDLARKYSDDVATRDKGGDLGLFSHGAMIESFERVAFTLHPGELSDVVRTDAGWDVMLCTQHDAVVAQPLRYIYTNVAWDAATEAADSMAKARIDSLAAVAHTVAQVRAVAKKAGLVAERTWHIIGQNKGTPEMTAFYTRLEATPPGSIVPGAAFDRSSGWFLALVDSVTAGRQAEWTDARGGAIEAYRQSAGRRAIDAKRAELDSLMSAGWSFDSLGTLAGGLDHLTDAAAGTTLGNLGKSSVLDSLVFGTLNSGPVLKDGQLTPWLDLVSGAARVRVAKRKPPTADRLSVQIENDRRVTFERKLYVYFQELGKRYPVKILDPVLRDTPLPPPPPPSH